jgi:CBS domain containing-hemolysin-like protein
MARHVIGNLDAYLSAAQLGITLASLGLGWIGEPIFADLLQPVFQWFDLAGHEHETLRESIAFVVGFASITFLHIVVGEQAPKSFGIRQPLNTALWVAYPMRAFHLVAYPFIWLLNESSLGLLRVLGLQPAHENEGASSEEELRVLVATSQKHFGASRFSRDIVQNAMELRHRIARDVMRPRQEITVLSTESSVAECLDAAEKTRYSRFPLCEAGNLDRLRGVVHIKDLYAMRLRAISGADLLPFARKLIYVPETARLEKLLQLFLERRLHMAIVVDEYGGTMGLVTIENVLEEVVGPIQDEFDQEKPLLVRAGEAEWDVDGALPLHELEEIVGEPLRAEGVSTANGLLTSRLGGFAKPGDMITLGTFELRAEEVDGVRVTRLKLRRRETDAEI